MCNDRKDNFKDSFYVNQKFVIALITFFKYVQ